MRVVTRIDMLRSQLSQWHEQGERIGFVPTMGYLHDGHLALIRQAQQECERVVVSIFVNPLQFNQASDFAAYPEDLQHDQQQLSAAGVDLLFLPSEQTIYPNGQQQITRVCVPGVTETLEGASRPGHFDGVATVVTKLFNLVQPTRAYFGEKDFQQLLLVKKMVQDLNQPLEIVAVATRREADGLAMSSRNARLDPASRKLAPLLYQALCGLRDELQQGQDFTSLQTAAEQRLQQAGFEVEYIALCDPDLQPLSRISDAPSRQAVLLIAARLGEVRLIDNLRIGEPD
jgi:pantoate--beta-alanine ligase